MFCLYVFLSTISHIVFTLVYLKRLSKLKCFIVNKFVNLETWSDLGEIVKIIYKERFSYNLLIQKTQI